MLRSLRQEDQKLKASLNNLVRLCLEIVLKRWKEDWGRGVCGSEHRVCLAGGSVLTAELMKSRVTWEIGF